MGDENYERILKKIAKSSGLGEEEIERRVEAKRAKLSGLISLEGAAQIVAAELGISFDNEKLKIDELLPGMRKVNVVGKVIGLSPVRTFTRNEKEGKVANLLIADETSNIKIVLWDTNHIELIEKGEIVENKVVEILNDYGFETHFITKLTDTELMCKRVEILPIEVVCRNYSAGSLCKRYGLEKGIEFDIPLIEFFVKDDELHDPLITPDVAIALGMIEKNPVYAESGFPVSE